MTQIDQVGQRKYSNQLGPIDQVDQIKQMQLKMLKWFDQNKRDLPWREDKDPYKIWLSEIMLQQTQVVTVIDYFNRFIEVYPDVFVLSKAKEEDVLKLWEGLGYYSRAKRLIPCAKEIVDYWGGVFPNTYEGIITLPGIGPYTAGAILSIAYDIKVPAVDGNVLRVYSRVFGINLDISVQKNVKTFGQIVEKTLPEKVGDFNQSIMELGALICKPKNYSCNRCPIQSICQAYKNQNQEAFPVKTKKIKRKHENVLLLNFISGDKRVIVKRLEKGLLPSLWGYLTVPYEGEINDFVNDFCSKHHIDHLKIDIGPSRKHIFTHITWHMTRVDILLSDQEYKEDKFKSLDLFLQEIKWIKYEAFDLYPIATAYKKILE